MTALHNAALDRSLTDGGWLTASLTLPADGLRGQGFLIAQNRKRAPINLTVIVEFVAVFFS